MRVNPKPTAGPNPCFRSGWKHVPFLSEVGPEWVLGAGLRVSGFKEAPNAGRPYAPGPTLNPKSQPEALNPKP